MPSEDKNTELKGEQKDRGTSAHLTSRRDESFKRYYLKYRTRIYWYVYRRITRDEEALDITADTFMKLYEHMENLEGRGSKGVLAWLYTVSRNQSIDYLRKQRGKNIRSIDDEEVDSATKIFDEFVEKEMEQSEIREIHDSLHVADELSREIMHLRYEEGLKFNEISKVVGKSEGACKMILYRNLEKVREELEKKREAKSKEKEESKVQESKENNSKKDTSKKENDGK